MQSAVIFPISFPVVAAAATRETGNGEGGGRRSRAGTAAAAVQEAPTQDGGFYLLVGLASGGGKSAAKVHGLVELHLLVLFIYDTATVSVVESLQNVKFGSEYCIYVRTRYCAEVSGGKKWAGDGGRGGGGGGWAGVAICCDCDSWSKHLHVLKCQNKVADVYTAVRVDALRLCAVEKARSSRRASGEEEKVGIKVIGIGRRHHS